MTEHETEMNIRPTTPASTEDSKIVAETHPDLERTFSVTSDGRTRSTFQIVCILTALFVGQLQPPINKPLTCFIVISFRRRPGCDHCSHCCTDDLERFEQRCRLHLDWWRVLAGECSFRAHLVEAVGHLGTPPDHVGCACSVLRELRNMCYG
jgi:hypothetical protein